MDDEELIEKLEDMEGSIKWLEEEVVKIKEYFGIGYAREGEHERFDEF